MAAIHLLYDPRDRLTAPIETMSAIGVSCIVMHLPAADLHAEDVPHISRELARLLLAQLAIAKD